MSRAQQAVARLPQVKQLAEQQGPVLKPAFALLLDGALIGPAGDRLMEGLAQRHRDARSGFYAAFDAVERLASEADGGPPRLAEPYIPGPPSGGRRATGDVRAGSPANLNRLGLELARAGRAWQDASRTLTGILGVLGLSTSPALHIGRAGDWVAAQKSEVDRRRDELLKADRTPVHSPPRRPESKGWLDRAREGFGQAWDGYVRHYLPGLWDGTRDIGLAGLASNPTTMPFYMAANWDSWKARGPIGQFQGLIGAVQHPVDFAKAAVDWELWQKDPMRAFGKTIPSVIIAVATGGTGAGAGAVTKAGGAAGRFGRVRPVHPNGRSDAGRPGDERAPRPLSPEALAELRRVEGRAQEVAGRHGVRVDFSGRPIDPANAAGFGRAIERVAAGYPSIFRAMENIKVQNLADMRATNPAYGPNVLGYSVGDKGPVPRGLYFNQDRFSDKAATDALAQKRAERGWSVPGGLTAEGTLYHEFGHQIGQRILADQRLCRELAAELRKAGLSVDDVSLHPGVPGGAAVLERGLGTYSRKDPSEMIAEAFAEWKLGSQPRPIASAIGAFIDKHFRGK